MSTSLRVAAATPGWLLVVLAAFGLVATAVVAGHRHHHAGGAMTEVARVSASPVPVPHRVVPSATIEHKAPRVPAAPADASEAVASALSSDYNDPGQCLAWVREQVGVASRYTDAATAWEHATGRRPHDPTPPRGAIVYWTGGSSGYGHVAISLGHGEVRSSDAEGLGAVGTVSIRHLDRTWHLHYAGWANSINGYRIPDVAAA